MTRCRRALVVGAGLLLGALSAAADDMLWRAPCAGAPARHHGAARAADREALRQNAPAQAWGRACARLAAGDTGFDALLELFDSLVALDRGDAAAQLLRGIERDADRQFWPPWAAAQLDLAEAMMARAASRYAEADAGFARALARLRATPGAPAPLLAQALTGRAAATIALNSKAAGSAEALLDEAQQLLAQAGLADSYAAIDIINQRTMLAYARDDWDAVLRWARRERDAVRRLSGPDAPAQLDALATLSALTSSQRRYDEALAYIAEGRRIGRLAPGASRSAYLGILNTWSPILLDLGRPTEALAAAQEAVATAVAAWGPGSVLTLTPLERRTRAEEALQQFAQARRSCAELLRLLQTEAGQVTMARRLRLIDFAAGFHARMNDLDTAQRLADEGLALTPDDGTLKYWRGRFLRRAAMIAGAEGRWADADALHGRSWPLLAGAVGTANPYLTGSLAMRCEAQTRAGLEAPACDAVRARLDALEDAAPSERVQARRALAQSAAATGQGAAALEHGLHALAAAQSAESQALLWRVLDGAAGSLRAGGQAALATLLAKAAVERIEAARGQFVGAQDQEAGYLLDKYAVYRRLADWLAEDGRVDEALDVIALLKGEEYRDFVRGRSSGPAPAAARLPWTAAERQWLAASPLAAPATESVFQRQAMARTAALESARLQAWRQALQRPVGPAPPMPARSGQQQQQPQPGALIATLFLGEQHANIVLQTAGERRLVRVAVDSRALSRDIGHLLAGIERRDDSLALLQSLYGLLAAPIAQQAQRVQASRLLLRLDGDLRYLPFGALHDGRSHLVERYAIQQQALDAPAADGSAAVRQDTAWLQAFGSARAVAGLPALPGVVDELCALVHGPVQAGDDGAGCTTAPARGAIPGRGWLNTAFTGARLQQALSAGRPERFDMLHIGTHFQLRPGEVGRSWMQLGDGQRLSLNELLSWRIVSQELVTLSACQTGVGGGAGVEGLATLMLKRGAGAVLASLWQVEDSGTSLLTRALYRALGTGQDAAAALRRAQLQALRSGPGGRAHPYHWAGFVLTTGRR